MPDDDYRPPKPAGSATGVSSGASRSSPCRPSCRCAGIAAAGFATDPRAERAYEWLLGVRLHDGSWPAGPKADLGRPAGPAPPEKDYRRLTRGHGCRSATTGAVACLALHPERDGDPRPPASASTTSSPARPGTRRPSAGRCPAWSGSNGRSGQVTFYVTFDLAFLLDLASRCGVSPTGPPGPRPGRLPRDAARPLRPVAAPRPSAARPAGSPSTSSAASAAWRTATGSATRSPPPSPPTSAARAATDPIPGSACLHTVSVAIGNGQLWGLGGLRVARSWPSHWMASW